MVAVTVLLYWPTVIQPYVYDDWLILYSLFSGSISAVSDAFTPFDKLIYRPVAMVYFGLVYTVFGLDATGCHVIALILHAVNGFLVAHVLRSITGVRAASFATGILYTAAASIHLDSLLWLVGFYDIGGMFFVLASFAFFLAKRNGLSVVCLALALLVKEATLFVVPVLVLYVLLFDASSWPKLRLHVVVAGGYILLKVLGTSPFQIEPDHPHRVDLWGEHIAANAGFYARWLGESFFPSLQLSGSALLGLAAILVIGAVIQAIGMHRPLSSQEKKHLVFFLAWTVVGLLPVLILTNQAARYYATYALVPFLFLILYLVARTIPDSRSLYRSIVFGGIVAGSVLSNLSHVGHIFAEERRGVAISEGRFHLIHKADTETRFRNELRRAHPTLPPHATVVVTGPSLLLGGDGAAVKLWYNDTTLRVISLLEYHRLREALPPDSLPEGKFYFIDMDEHDAH
jgi:hypothetical protein